MPAGGACSAWRFSCDMLAVPRALLTGHEVANFNLPTRQIAVTYCHLTGSTLVFEPARRRVSTARSYQLAAPEQAA